MRTAHESAAITAYAAIASRPASRFSIVHRPEPGVWYDFADPETGKYGQCCMGEDGKWKQEPRGVQPVVMAFRARKERVKL